MFKSFINSRVLAISLISTAAIFSLLWILIHWEIIPSPGWHGDTTMPHHRPFMTDRSAGLDLCWKPSHAPADPRATGSVYLRWYLGVDDASPLKIIAMDLNAPDPTVASPSGLAVVTRAFMISLPNWIIVLLLCLQPLWVVLPRFRKRPANLCPTCSSDLRASMSKDKCSGCGSPILTKNA